MFFFDTSIYFFNLCELQRIFIVLHYNEKTPDACDLCAPSKPTFSANLRFFFSFVISRCIFNFDIVKYRKIAL